jgi:hypothetical protein
MSSFFSLSCYSAHTSITEENILATITTIGMVEPSRCIAGLYRSVCMRVELISAVLAKADLIFLIEPSPKMAEDVKRLG